MKPVLVVTHLEDRDTGLARAALQGAGRTVLQVDKAAGAQLPALDDVSGIVSLGGRESATRADTDPFLAAEVKLMAAALARELPVLGMCLGAQLLALAGGGRVGAIGRTVADWVPIAPRPAAADDPLFGALPAGLPVLKWHEDMIETPPGAGILATAPGPGEVLFALGARAWGSQAHLEATPRLLLDTWLADRDGAAEITAAGHPIERFRARSREALERQMPVGREVFTRFARRL